MPTRGWSEPAATNAPVQDEPVEVVLRMNKNPILLALMDFFFPPLLCPKISPPPTYHLPPSPTYHLPPPSYLPPTPLPTYHLPPPSYLPLTNPSPLHSIARAPETLNGSELGAGVGAVGARAWSCQSLELGTVPGVGAGPTRYRGKPSSFLFFLQCSEPSSSIFFCCAAA